MYFVLRSEIETKKRHFCPYCNQGMIKRLHSHELYNKYSCWNKQCEHKGEFIVLNKLIENEDYFDVVCPSCEDPYDRRFKIDLNNQIYLYFSCKGKLCEANMDPLTFNLTRGKWEGNIPKFPLFEEKTEIVKKKQAERKAKIKKVLKRKISLKENEELHKKEKELPKPFRFCKVGEIPLLTMTPLQYQTFLEHHDHKAVVLVDVPNFIRTMYDLYPRDFENILKKSRHILLRTIENSFGTGDKYIIRYYSKPDEDLDPWNALLMEFCSENPEHEFFHLLEIQKSGKFSDIDNYLIANGVEILERCQPRGFIIVSSDKDYLLVMRIAAHKKVRKYIYGINTADIYEKYGINDIQLLGSLNFFDK